MRKSTKMSVFNLRIIIKLHDFNLLTAIEHLSPLNQFLNLTSWHILMFELFDCIHTVGIVPLKANRFLFRKRNIIWSDGCLCLHIVVLEGMKLLYHPIPCHCFNFLFMDINSDGTYFLKILRFFQELNCLFVYNYLTKYFCQSWMVTFFNCIKIPLISDL